jgi:Carboxypeptidase regulatory-like domain
MLPANNRLRRMSLLSALLIASMALFTSGCLWGVVQDSQTGAPIAGANVSYVDSYGHMGTATTNSKGLYWFDSATGPIPALGPVSVNVSAPGYNPLSLPTLVQYNDNPNASVANFSSFWDVQSFVLSPFGTTATTADIAVTDLFPDNQPQGAMWARITNNGPDTLSGEQVSVIVVEHRFTLTDPSVEEHFTDLPTQYTLNLAPGQTQAVNLGIQIDTSSYRYDFTVQASAVGFVDAASGNNTYQESVEPIWASLALTNASGANITSIQFRLAGDPSWGDNRLNPGEVVLNGQTRGGHIPAGTYDLRAYIGQQVLDERLNVGITGTYDWTVLAALDIWNSPPNWWPIEVVRIYPESSSDVGPNWLNPGETIAPGAVRRFNVATNVYMLLVEGPGGGFPRGHHGSAVAGVCAWSPGTSIFDPGVFFCVQ